MSEVKKFEIDGELRECVVMETHPEDDSLVRVRTRGHNPISKWVSKDGGKAAPKKKAKPEKATATETPADTGGDGDGEQAPAADWPDDLDARLRNVVDEHDLIPADVRGAEVSQLTKLKGVGEATAKALIEAAG